MAAGGMTTSAPIFFKSSSIDLASTGACGKRSRDGWLGVSWVGVSWVGVSWVGVVSGTLFTSGSIGLLAFKTFEAGGRLCCKHTKHEYMRDMKIAYILFFVFCCLWHDFWLDKIISKFIVAKKHGENLTLRPWYPYMFHGAYCWLSASQPVWYPCKYINARPV